MKQTAKIKIGSSDTNGLTAGVLPMIKRGLVESTMWHKSYNQFDKEPMEGRTF